MSRASISFAILATRGLACNTTDSQNNAFSISHRAIYVVKRIHERMAYRRTQNVLEIDAAIRADTILC